MFWFSVTETERIYVYAFLVALLLWPVFFIDSSWWPLVVNLLVYLLVDYRLSMPTTSFVVSLMALARSFRSGVVNITMFYIIPVLAILYVFAVGYALSGLGLDRSGSTARWHSFVEKVVNRKWLPGA
jgi:hypothetical protein